LIIEPIRITLAGCSTASRASPSAWRGVGTNSGRSTMRGSVGSDIVEVCSLRATDEERHEELGRCRRAVPAEEIVRAGVGRLDESDIRLCHQRHIAEAGDGLRADDRAEPPLLDDL